MRKAGGEHEGRPACSPPEPPEGRNDQRDEVLLGLEAMGRSAAVAISAEFDDRRMEDQAIDSGDGHGFVGEDRIPIAERLIAGDDQRPPFVGLLEEFPRQPALSN